MKGCKKAHLFALWNIVGSKEPARISLLLLYIFFFVINYRFLTTETNLKALYIFRCLFTTSSVKLFVVTVQIFVYKSLFTIVFFGKRKNNTHETFHILKMKAHFENAPHFENRIAPLERILTHYSGIHYNP